MKLNPSKPKEECDTKHNGSGVALAPSHAPAAAAAASFQADRSEMNKKIPQAEAIGSAHFAQKTRKKANSRKERRRNKEECHHNILDESSQCNEETKPGTFSIAGLQEENCVTEGDQPTMVDESNLVESDDNARAMLVEADLAPELTLAEEVNIQAEEEIVLKKAQYKRVLWFAMVFYVFAIIGNIAGFVIFFAVPFGQTYQTYGCAAAAGFVLIAAVILFVPARPCCRSSVSLEEYAPDDAQLLRDAQIASIASFFLFTCVAIPCILRLPERQWLGYAVTTWYFAGTMIGLSCVLLLRRSKDTRQKKPKWFWVLFVLFFFGLTGLTIWRCLIPEGDVLVGYWIGNGLYDGDVVCDHDGGDCVQLSQDYPGCIVLNPHWIGNGVCNGGDYNTSACGYDGGDCAHENTDYPGCIVQYPSWIGNGNCDGRLYGTVECGFDGGDCLGPGERCRGHEECASEVCNSITKVCDSMFASEVYPNCSVDKITWIGDGECDGGYYASEACGFDGGDCLELGKPCLLDEECSSGFCSTDTKVCYLGTLENYPDCIVEYPRKIGNGDCDDGAYATETCGYDGGDCLNPAEISSGSLALLPYFHVTFVFVLLSKWL